MSSTFDGTGAPWASFFKACSATGRAMPKDTRAFNASCSNVLFINGEIFDPVYFFPTLSRSSRMILSADFLPIPFDAFQLLSLTLNNRPCQFLRLHGRKHHPGGGSTHSRNAE